MEFDPNLPITQRLDDIAQALSAHQVIIVAGETGSGKTTQLPKLCLTLGRTSIAHTQPRRIAARSVAERIADETTTTLGDLVGYQVRFTRKAGRSTQLKVMTDGILLAEINHDRDLRAYDTIIIDEAHERSLNIDFLLGYLKRLLPRRPELKVIITSATIDTQRFSTHFDDAPIVEVGGRGYPVEVRYRPLTDDDGGHVDQTDGVCQAVTELRSATRGDVLVFLAGEREIRDAAEAIAAMKLPNTEVLPLFSRLSAAEQHRIFAPHSARRIVLATNVAETSITVPGITGVIDAGTARISRYSARTKVQRLPIEAISQASANQRAGRCGRVAPGVCIRLYSEEDFAARAEFTEPEILRTNLASVILHMAQARLGAIEDFPFVEPPDRSRISDGLRLLTELGALAPAKKTDRYPRLTKIGHQLARIPLDPRLARMLLAADDLGCLREVLVIVAGLSIQDPRERPTENRAAAEELHRRFQAALRDDAEPDHSDFLAWYRLWQYVRTQRAAQSGNGFRRLCQREYLNYLRIREWQDLHAQLREIAREIGLTTRDVSADPDVIHQALLTGLLSNIGLAELGDKARSAKHARTRGPRQYLGTRGTKFAINPGSALAKTPPPLVMAGEIVETTRLWARVVAPIDAQWVERAAGLLCTRQHSEPHFSARTASVVAFERTSLWGVPLVADRVVNYARIDATAARDIFIRQALVEQQWRTRHDFYARNARLRADVTALADRTRSGSITVDDEAIYAFYDQRLPADITSGASFDKWWKHHGDDGMLDLTAEDLLTNSVDFGGYPDVWTVGGHDLPVSYVWSPGEEHDGVTVDVDLRLIHHLPPAAFTWQVPGLRDELIVAWLRALPKPLRTQLVPIPDTARRVRARLDDVSHDQPLTEAIADLLRADYGVVVGSSDWGIDRVADHLQVNFRIRDGDGAVVAAGRDLASLQRDLTEQASAELTTMLPAAAAVDQVTGATTWSFGDLKQTLPGSHGVLGYPALRDEGASVGLAVADGPRRQRAWHRQGLRRLCLLNTPDPTLWVVSHLSNTDKLALQLSPYPAVVDLLADARLATVAALIDELVDVTTIRTEADFRRLCDAIRAEVPQRMREVVALTAEVCRRYGDAQRAARQLPGDSEIAEDVGIQLAELVYVGFLSTTPPVWIERLPVYLSAIKKRIDAWNAGGIARDEQQMDTVLSAERVVAARTDTYPPGPVPPEVEELTWLLEELRVSLFAQQLGTRQPVSVKRIRIAAERAPASWIDT